jgi:hypothetical protein
LFHHFNSSTAAGLPTLIKYAFVLPCCCRDLTFVDVPVAAKPLDTKQPGRGVTKVAVDLQVKNAPDTWCMPFFCVTAGNLHGHSNCLCKWAVTLAAAAAALHVVHLPAVDKPGRAAGHCPVFLRQLQVDQLLLLLCCLQWTNPDVQPATAQFN